MTHLYDRIISLTVSSSHISVFASFIRLALQASDQFAFYFLYSRSNETQASGLLSSFDIIFSILIPSKAFSDTKLLDKGTTTEAASGQHLPSSWPLTLIDEHEKFIGNQRLSILEASLS